MKYQILLVLFTIALVCSVILSLPGEDICDTEDSCTSVKISDYDKTFGIKNSYYGVVIFAILFLLTFSHMKRPMKYKRFIITTAVILGSVIAVYFIYMQQFVLQLYCKYCLITDISILVALVVIIFSRKHRWKK